ncbi:MDR family MFS transporter [Actinokineospora sp. G85]|uniref:MDR family MFS transporter n=1 Tax=Actinokineospora sp. G85 TaxID=3406626 RepID=UPI003C77AD56
METKTDSPVGEEAQPLDRKLLVLGAVLVPGALAALLDTTIVIVAIDGLAKEFGAPVTTIQWVTTAYLLAMGSVIPLTGWAMDRFGPRTAWLASLSVFFIGSVLCGVAWSAESLIAFRVVQGLGGGMILPLLQAILAQVAGPRRFGRIMALVGIPGQLAPIIGPVVGGVIVDQLNWRWIFFVNIPVVGLAILAGVRGVPRGERKKADKLDVTGLALLSPGVVALIFGLSQLGGGGEGHHASATAAIVSATLGVVLLGAFTVHALRRKEASLIDLRLFRKPSFASVSALMFLSGVSTWGSMFLLPLFYQQARGLGALDAGLLLAPQGVGIAVAMLFGGRLADRGTPAWLMVFSGLTLTALTTVPFALADGQTSDWVLGAALLLRGVGVGVSGIAMMASIYRGLPESAYGRATTTTNIIQRVGASFGTAVLAVILQSGLTAGGAFDAFGATFWWSAAFVAIGLVPGLLLAKRA